MKRTKRIFALALSLLMVISMAVITGVMALAAPSSPLEPFAPKTGIRFGVMSDTHIGAAALSSLTPETRLATAYQAFDRIDSSMDAIITVGDFTQNGTLAEFNTYKQIMDAHSTARTNLLSMGNHECYELNGQAITDRFENVFGMPATADTVVGGYHFITVSTTDRVFNTTSLAQHREWLEARLDAAHAEDPAKPIFVFIHQTIIDTCIGSRQSQASPEHDLREVLSKYSQVVTFSGHSHASTIDPRNIWQGDYTALNCGSVYYAVLDFTNPLTAGQTNNSLIGYAPANRGESNTGLVVDVDGTVVTVRRIDMYYGREIAPPFVFDTSVDKADFPYRLDKRIAASSAPEFAPDAEIRISDLTRTGCSYTFDQAENTSASIPDDGAFAYTVSIRETASGVEVDTARLTSNYFMLPLPATVSFSTNRLKENTAYTISIMPIGFFGKEGEALSATFVTTGSLTLTTDANLVKAGDYFKLYPSFDTIVNSNAAILTFTFDAGKFQYRGFTPAAGATLVNTVVDGGQIKLTVMTPDYSTKDFGEILFSAKDDAALANEDNVIGMTAELAVKEDDETKSIRRVQASVTFTTSAGAQGPYTLIDLSNLIDWFGVKAGDAAWAQARFFDVNGNGEIDIQDIASLAQMID